MAIIRLSKGMTLALLAIVAGGGCSNLQFPPGSDWPTSPAAPFASQARWAITDNRSDTLSFVSTENPTTMLGAFNVGNVPVELEGPHHIAASPDGRFLYFNLSNYVPGTGSGPHGAHGSGNVPGSLVKLSARTGEAVGEVLVDRNPGEVILSRDGTRAFVTHYDLLRLQGVLSRGEPIESAFSELIVIDTENMARLARVRVCPTAHGAALSSDDKTIYISCTSSDELAVVDISDPSAPAIRAKVPVGPSPGPPGFPNYSPYAVAVSPRDGTVWISNTVSGDIRVFDPISMTMQSNRTVFLNGVVMFGTFTRDGSRFYVPTQGVEQVASIDAVTMTKEVVQLPETACLSSHVFALHPDGMRGVLVCEGDHVRRPGTAVSFLLEPLSVLDYSNVGLFPDGVVWLPPVP